MKHRIQPFLWFDTQAEEAAKFYVSIFRNSRILTTSKYEKKAAEMGGLAEGSVMTVAFELDGLPVTALNGGPHFKFNEAVSLQVNCENQEEIDYYWNALTKGGDPKGQQCGWLKDKFGLCWQVVPMEMPELMKGKGAKGATEALLKMKKLDIAELRRAYKAAS